MKLSCIPVSFFDAIRNGEMSIVEWLDFAAELGLEGVECAPPLLRPLGPAVPAEYRRMAEQRGLKVSNYTAYSDFTFPNAADRIHALAEAIQNVAVATELGAPSVRVLAGQRRPQVTRSQGIAWVVEAIQLVAEVGARAGIQVNLENHTRASTWEDFDFAMAGSVFLEILQALADSPVGVQFDTANPMVAGEQTLPLFEKVSSRIRYVHINDVARAGEFRFVTVGSGIVPNSEVIRRLRTQGYSGWLGIEEAGRTGRDGFRQAVKAVRRWIAEA